MVNVSAICAAALALLLCTPLEAADPALPELFNRAKSAFAAGDYKRSLADFDLLDTNSRAPGFERDRAQLAPAITFYRAANLAALGRKDEAKAMFVTYLAYMPNAAITSPPYSKPVLAAFEQARKEVASRSKTIGGAYEHFVVPAGWSYPADAQWHLSAVRYLLTDAQKKEYASLTSDPVRAQFVDRFWGQLDPTPGTAENEFRREFERRLAFADAAFSAEGRGRDTDRGVTFALLGPPTYAAQRPLDDDVMGKLRTGGTDRVPRTIAAGQIKTQVTPDTRQDNLEVDEKRGKRESWYYREGRIPAGVPHKEVQFAFVSKEGYGIGVLQKDPEPLRSLLQAAENARASKKLN